MSIKFLYPLFITVLLSSCCIFGKNCKDVVHRDITQEELDFFTDYKVNDTIYYKDVKSSNKYHLICYKNDINIRKRIFFDEHQCAGDGYYMIYDEVDIFLRCNFPKGNFIEFNYISREKENLWITFVQTMVYTYDYLSDRLQPKPLSNRVTDFYDKLHINGTYYHNVHVLIKQDMFYDSIFYNSEFGFLRLVSSEENLDIILDR